MLIYPFKKLIICTFQAAYIRETMDPRIAEKIKELVSENQQIKVSQLATFLKNFAINNILKDVEVPNLMERRYFPTNKDIRNLKNQIIL